MGEKIKNKIKSRDIIAHKSPYSQSYGFSSSHIRMWELDYKEGWAPKNWYLPIVVLQKTRESLGSPKEIKPVNPKGNQPWIFTGRTCWNSNILATRCKELIHWKKTLMLGKIESRRRGGNRGWDGWMASPTQWTWVWANSGRQWRTERPGTQQLMGCKESDKT